MSSTLKVIVNELHEFDITEKAALNLDIVTSTPTEFHVLHDAVSYNAQLLASNFNDKSYVIEVNNETFIVDISDALDQQIAMMGFSTNGTQDIVELHAPMPGLILEIFSTVGQQVHKDEPILILEAMKMENTILSPRDGIIKSIHVNIKEAVDKNQLLIEFE